MSELPTDHSTGTVCSPLQRLLHCLGCYPDHQPTEAAADRLLCSLPTEAQNYLQQTLTPGKWPPSPPKTAVQALTDTCPLKNWLGCTLAKHDFQRAVLALLLLETSPTAPLHSSLFHDVMLYVEDQGAGDVIPPQLLLSWAKGLQTQGDLHGAVRRLNAAKTMLTEHKGRFLCSCEAEQIQAECLQLAGLTLNKMCCWKSAIMPLMESAGIFRSCGGSDKHGPAIVKCVEMAARCLCNITHGDFLELKEELGFLQHDRFYQAYMMCKESASLATSSPLLSNQLQNRAAECLLKFAAQQEDSDILLGHLHSVSQDALQSLHTHTSLKYLEHREQFFHFIHSLFILHLALSFSSHSADQIFVRKLGEWARFLYAQYCQQLSDTEFLGDRIDIESLSDLKRWICSLSEELGLKLHLQNVPSHTAENEKTVNSLRDSLYQNTSNGSKDKSQQVLEWNQPGMGNREEETSSAHRQEVGLPINPEEYAIPVYDVPLTIFQDLCGCKFSDDQTPFSAEVMTGLHSASQETPITAMAKTDNGHLQAITIDSVHGSSVALVDSVLTTQLPDSEGNRDGTGSDLADSGFSSSSSSTPKSDISLTTPITNSDTAIKGPSDTSNNSVHKGRLLKFNPVTGLWSSQSTLVYVGKPLALADKVKGKCREALHVQFLHQDELLGRYVGKRYRRQRPASQYLQDVTCQKTARFLVTLFNYALNDLRYDIQVVYVPVAHVQLLSRDGEEVCDWLNVEPYLEGDFIKLTNNLSYCNSQATTLATALTHFSHSVSQGHLMLVDLQGWLPREGRGVVYLTDPQFHTLSPSSSLSSCDLGARGMQAFWQHVHPHCNAICRALGLQRPPDHSPQLREKEN